LATHPPLRARALAEGLGTGLLVAAVIGSGIAAQDLSEDTGLQLLENTLATIFALAALILALGAVSGAHLNPAVTLVERVRGAMTTRDALAYGAAQVAGGVAGAVVANLMFELPAVELSTHDRATAAHLLAEVVATFGLLVVIRGVVHAGRATAVAFAVAGYIGAAYWFTSSTSFANPAVTFARTLSDTFAGIKPSSVPAFVIAQLIGGSAAVALGVFLHPDLPATADAVIVPHDSNEKR
jgi:glycerol uptake facilitator-like aquaporin